MFCVIWSAQRLRPAPSSKTTFVFPARNVSAVTVEALSQVSIMSQYQTEFLKSYPTPRNTDAG